MVDLHNTLIEMPTEEKWQDKWLVVCILTVV